MDNKRYSISLVGAIQIMEDRFQISPKSIVRAEYHEDLQSEDPQWWEFTITEEKDFQKYKLSLLTEKVYLAGQALKDEEDEADDDDDEDDDDEDDDDEDDDDDDDWEAFEDEDAIAYCLLPSSNNKANSCSLAFLKDFTDVPF